MRFGDSTSSAQPTKSPSSFILAKSLSRSLSDRVFESGKRVGREGELLVLPVPASPRPCTCPGIRSPGVHLGLTCHFQGLQICQAGQGAITDGVDHGAWESGGATSEPVKAAIPVPSSPLFSVPSPMARPFPVAPPSPGPVQSRLRFEGNLHPPEPAPPPRRPRGRTQHRAPARLIDTQGAGLFAAHRGHRRVQAAAARIVPLQLAEIHVASAAETRSAGAGLGARFPRAPQRRSLPTNRRRTRPAADVGAQQTPLPRSSLEIVVPEADGQAPLLGNRVGGVAFRAPPRGLCSPARWGWWEERKIKRRLRRALQDPAYSGPRRSNTTLLPEYGSPHHGVPVAHVHSGPATAHSLSPLD